MRRHAKASSAFIFGRTGLIALAFAMTLSMCLANVTGASAATKFFSGSSIGTTSGTPTGTAYGGTFSSGNGGVGDIAINNPSITTDGTDQSGWIYVVDRGNNRVQAFEPDLSFALAWGAGVVVGGATGTGTVTSGSASVTSVVTTSKAFTPGQTITGTGIAPGTTITAVGAGTITLSQAATPDATGAGTAISSPTGGGNVDGNEQQTVTVSPAAASGTFTLTYTTPNPSNTSVTTPAIDWDASANVGPDSVQANLEGLANVGAGNVEVTGPDGGPYTVEFKGTRFADTDVNQITAAASGFTAAVGSQHTCTSSTSSDNTSFQWLANGAPAPGAGAGSATYTIHLSDAGKTIQCRVTKSNNANNVGSTQVSNPVVVATPSGAAPTAPTSFSITGTATAGSTLTCPATGFSGASGATPFTYTWLKNGSTVLEQQGPTASTSDTYTLTASDVSPASAFQCLVVASNADGSVAKASNNKVSSSPFPAAPGGNTSSPNAAVSFGVSTATRVPGGSAFEICVAATECKAGVLSSAGGGFDVAAGLDIDQASGNVYVRERNNNRRVQQFEADGEWVRAFGWDVVQPGGVGESSTSLDEIQSVTLVPPSFGAITGGTFSLTFDSGSGAQTTAPIPFNAPPAPDPEDPELLSVEEALEDLAAFAPADVEVTSPNPGGEAAPGGPYTIAFSGAYAATDLEPLAADASALQGEAFGSPAAPTIAVGTIVDGALGVPGFETCTVASQCQAASAGVQPGQFGSSTQASNGIAVAPPGAPNAGAVYVADPAAGNCRVLSFDASAPTVVPGEPFGSCNFGGTAAASGSSQFIEGYPRDVAAGPDGVVYASNGQGVNGGFVNRYESVTHSFLGRVNDELTTGELGSGQVQGLEVDPASGHLLVGRPDGAGIVELDLSEMPEEVDESHIVDTHVKGLGSGNIFLALGAGGAPGRYFASTSTAIAGTGSGQRVLVFDESGVQPPPDVDIDPAEDVTATTATFKGHIDPVLVSNFTTSYHWQISKDSVNWVDVTPSQIVPPDGFTAANVTHAATGLEPNTLYRLRIRTDRSSGAGTHFSATQLFLTDPMPPVVETRPARQVSDTTAQLVGELNPGGLAATYWFEWGEGGLTETAPAVPATASGGHFRLVGETLAGLAPDTVYQYRLCAENPVSAGKVCHAILDFRTRPAAVSPVAGRSYEMVTHPDKPLRRGGERGERKVFGGNPDISHVSTAVPSLAGGRVLVNLFGGASTEDADTGFTWGRNYYVFSREVGGAWGAAALFNTPVAPGGSAAAAAATGRALSPDLEVFAVNPTFAGGASIFPKVAGKTVGSIAIRDMGSSAGPLGAGWYPWHHPDWLAGPGERNTSFLANIDDASHQLVAQPGFESQASINANWRDVTPADGGPAPQASVDPGHPVLDPPQVDGSAVFLSEPAWDFRPADLVNECTGTFAGGDRTLIPARLGAGAVTDTIGTRDCEQGSPTDVRGAVFGSLASGRLGDRSLGALSAGARRVFFTSPDPNVAASGCATATSAATACPPQLFVRQYDAAGGNPVVRWISRAEEDLFEAPQQIGLLGNGVAFEGASRDGSIVYFRTNAPLTADDPNGGPLGSRPVTTGTASPLSWDLYRYELPAGDADPGGGTLTRVSGGPDADADPNTNCTGAAADCGGASNGAGNALRFLSEDGERAYFVTAGRIPAADNAPPLGSGPGNAPSAVGDQANTATRNLYYADFESGEYRFVARLPFALNGLASCASSAGKPTGPVRGPGTFGAGAGVGIHTNSGMACVYGSRSGDALLFETAAQLTADDSDAAYDVYLYDAPADELIRLSAPPPGTLPYECLHVKSGDAVATCNGDLGMSNTGSFSTDTPHWGIGHDPEGNLDAVFFESRLPLAPAAAANDAMKVFQWRRDGGHLALLSPVGTADSAFFSGNSPDGRDVYFWTEQRLSPWEVEDADGDIYNATTRTDLRPPPSPPPSACEVLGGSCQPPALPPPPASDAGSGSIQGQGNFVPRRVKPRSRRCAKGKVRRGGKCVTKPHKTKSKKAKRKKAKHHSRANADRRAAR